MAHAWKACWVQALGGSNPPSSATGPRDLLRFRGFCCLWRRWCSGRRRARPPARSPHASFARSGRSRSPPVPSGPSGALHTGGTYVAEVWTGASSRSPAGLASRSTLYPQFRMQFPNACSLRLCEKPGISTITFQSMKYVRGNCMRNLSGAALPPPSGAGVGLSGHSGARHPRGGGGFAALGAGCRRVVGVLRL